MQALHDIYFNVSSAKDVTFEIFGADGIVMRDEAAIETWIAAAMEEPQIAMSHTFWHYIVRLMMNLTMLELL